MPNDVLPFPQLAPHHLARGLRFAACRVEADVDGDGDGPRLDLLFANASQSPKPLRLRLAVTVDSRKPGRPHAIRSDHACADEGPGLGGRVSPLRAGELDHFHRRVPGAMGDHVVVVADRMDTPRPERLAFEGYISERSEAPDGPYSRRFGHPFVLGRRADRAPLPTPPTFRRDQFRAWEDLAWAQVRRGQLNALYQEAWLRAFKSRWNGYPEAQLFEYVHAGVLVLRPRSCGTHEFGEEPGFSVVVALAVVDAIDAFRADPPCAE